MDTRTDRDTDTASADTRSLALDALRDAERAHQDARAEYITRRDAATRAISDRDVAYDAWSRAIDAEQRARRAVNLT